MLVKATENCVESLMPKVIKADDIVVRNPSVNLDTACWQNLRIDCTCQVDTLSPSSENWFESFLECMDMTEVELDTLLIESEEDSLLPDPIDCIVQAINSIHFDWPRCPILRLQNQLQAKGLKIDILEQNPLFFKIFKQELYKEFQSFLFLVLKEFQSFLFWPTSSAREYTQLPVASYVALGISCKYTNR